jgi:hypothetical protein
LEQNKRLVKLHKQLVKLHKQLVKLHKLMGLQLHDEHKIQRMQARQNMERQSLMRKRPKQLKFRLQRTVKKY